jgi:hypothetical protein
VIVKEKLPKLANARMSKALVAIRRCATLARYKPSEKQAKDMADTLKREADSLLSILVSGQRKNIEYHLPFDS